MSNFFHAQRCKIFAQDRFKPSWTNTHCVRQNKESAKEGLLGPLAPWFLNIHVWIMGRRLLEPAHGHGLTTNFKIPSGHVEPRTGQCYPHEGDAKGPKTKWSRIGLFKGSSLQIWICCISPHMTTKQSRLITCYFATTPADICISHGQTLKSDVKKLQNSVCNINFNTVLHILFRRTSRFRATTL